MLMKMSSRIGWVERTETTSRAASGQSIAEQIHDPNVDGFVHLDEDGALARAVDGFYAAQEKGEKCPFRVPLESSQRMPKTLNRLRVAFASESRRATG